MSLISLAVAAAALAVAFLLRRGDVPQSAWYDDHRIPRRARDAL